MRAARVRFMAPALRCAARNAMLFALVTGRRRALRRKDVGSGCTQTDSEEWVYQNGLRAGPRSSVRARKLPFWAIASGLDAALIPFHDHKMMSPSKALPRLAMRARARLSASMRQPPRGDKNLRVVRAVAAREEPQGSPTPSASSLARNLPWA